MRLKSLSSVLAAVYDVKRVETINERPNIGYDPNGSIHAGQWTVFGGNGTEILGPDMTMRIVTAAFESSNVALYHYHDHQIICDPPMDDLVMVAVYGGHTFVATSSVSADD